MIEMNPQSAHTKVASNEKNIPSVVSHIVRRIGASAKNPTNAIIWKAIIIVVIILTSILWRTNLVVRLTIYENIIFEPIKINPIVFPII